MNIENMKIAGLRNPLGLDEKSPILTWEIKKADSDQNNLVQRCFSVRVEAEHGHIWESGRIESSQQCICLDGMDLQTCSRYFVTLNVETDDGSSTKGTTFWETGFLKTKKWSGKWIGPDREKRQTVQVSDAFGATFDGKESQESDSTKDLYPVVRFQKSVAVADKKVKKARIYATARGVYELMLNDRKVGNMELAPEYSAYDHYLQYQTYDITKDIVAGINEIAVLLADGYYIGRIGMTGIGYDYGDAISFLLQAEIEYEDGSIEMIVSDESWRYAETNILYSDIFIGEKQNLMAEAERSTRLPRVLDESYKVLIGQSAEPLQILDELQAVDILHTPSGETVIDFGQVLAGKVCITVNGNAGNTVVMEHQETLDENGNFFFNIPRFNCEQRDEYILRDGRQVLSPRFTVHGFRYVRISGDFEKLQVEDCKALVVGSSCEKTMDFACSDQNFNQLQHNIQWSQKGNFFSIPMDCPQRERAGWTGDIQIYSETACYNAYVLPFLKRWLAQVRAEQLPGGEIPIVVPYSRGYKMMQQQFGAATSAGWGDVGVILPWTLYRMYGDKIVLAENYEMMERWIAYISRQASIRPKDADNMSDKELEYRKYIWDEGFHFGDWLYPSARDEHGVSDAFLSAMSSKDRVAPAFYAYSVQTMIKISRVLGKQKEAAYYETLDQKIKEAYAALYVEEDGRILPELQGIYVLALQMGLIPEDKREKTTGHLVRMIHENQGCLDTGFLSVPFLLDVLYNNGRKEEAFRLLYNEQCPSWLYEVKKGATTIWESWDAVTEDGRPNITSFNHYAFGCVGSWIYRTILGLSPQSAGFRKVRICPEFDCGLEWAKGYYHTGYGDIKIDWKKEKDGIKLRVDIPIGVSAYIEMQDHEKSRKETVGSGSYSFMI